MHVSYLDYYIKLLYFHPNVSATAVRADLKPCLTSPMNLFAKENLLKTFGKVLKIYLSCDK